MNAIHLRGSPLYMAPEIITCRFYNEKADLWSVGVILYGEPCLWGTHVICYWRTDLLFSCVQIFENYLHTPKVGQELKYGLDWISQENLVIGLFIRYQWLLFLTCLCIIFQNVCLVDHRLLLNQ